MQKHWDPILWILRYIDGSPQKELCMKDIHFQIEAYSDTMLGLLKIGMFTSGFCVFVGVNLVS